MQKTIKNLTKAFIGESQARNRYSMYFKIAKKEGYEKIADLFFLTADQEAEHAKWLMRMIVELKDGNKEYDEIKVEAEAPTILGDTKENLKAAISGENFEHSSMYPDFAKTAEDEGLESVAGRLRSIAIAEQNHEQRYRTVLNELENGKIFENDEEVFWECKKCGYRSKTKNAPEECPSCGHPQAYFSVQK